MQKIVVFLVAASTALSSKLAVACPYCNEGIRKQVFAGIFDERFGHNVLFTIAPFIIFGGLIAAIHFSGPQRVQTREIPRKSPGKGISSQDDAL